MAKITYLAFDGSSQIVEVSPGLSVMEGALRNNILGIDADCGGACACATCHVYVDPEWTDRVGPATTLEGEMLEYAEGVEPNSRLSCQIKVTEDLDGLVVRTPASQQ